MNVSDITLVMTCGHCPEQYDAFVGNTQVGYLRLRHGGFTVRCPGLDFENEVVYSANTKGDGEFDDGERSFHLDTAKRAICEWWNKKESE